MNNKKKLQTQRRFDIYVRSYSLRKTLLFEDTGHRVFRFVTRIHYVREYFSKALRPICFNLTGVKRGVGV